MLRKRLDARKACYAYAANEVQWVTSAAVSTDANAESFSSYGVEIAKKLPFEWFDRKVAWVTSKRHSVTTSKHTTWVAGALAIEGWLVISMEEVPGNKAAAQAAYNVARFEEDKRKAEASKFEVQMKQVAEEMRKSAEEVRQIKVARRQKAKW